MRRVVAINGEAREVELMDYGVRRGWGEAKLAADCSIKDHLAVLEVAQRHVDSAVSKTCNVPASTPWHEFKDIYVKAWEMGAKGITTFTDGGKRAGIMVGTPAESEEGPSCRIDEVTGRRECA